MLTCELGRLPSVVVGGILVPSQGCFKSGSCGLDVDQASDLGPVSLPPPPVKRPQYLLEKVGGRIKGD